MFARIVPKSFSTLLPKAPSAGEQAILTKKITASDIQKFIDLSGDSNPVHSGNIGQRALVHGAYLNSLVSCVMGTKLPGPGTLVVKQTLNFPNKCFVDDIVTVTVKILDARKIIKVEFSCDVQAENKTVLYGTAHLVMDK